jgi:hypothetical protein
MGYKFARIVLEREICDTCVLIRQSQKAWNEVVCQTESVTAHHRLVRRGLGPLSAVICKEDSSA